MCVYKASQRGEEKPIAAAKEEVGRGGLLINVEGDGLLTRY